MLFRVLMVGTALAVLGAAACTTSEVSVASQKQSNWLEVDSSGLAQARQSPAPNILPQTHFAAAQLHEAQGQLDQALLQYRRATLLNHNYVAAYHRMGLLLGRLGRHAEAAAALEKTVALRDDVAALHNNLGYEYALLERWDDAEAALRRAIELEPRFVRAQVNLGMVLGRVERFEEALAAFAEVLPESAAYYNVGLMYQGQSHYADAAACYEKVLSIDPTFYAARYQLDRIAVHLTPALTDPAVQVLDQPPQSDTQPPQGDAWAPQGDNQPPQFDAEPLSIPPCDEPGESGGESGEGGYGADSDDDWTGEPVYASPAAEWSGPATEGNAEFGMRNAESGGNSEFGMRNMESGTDTPSPIPNSEFRIPNSDEPGEPVLSDSDLFIVGWPDTQSVAIDLYDGIRRAEWDTRVGRAPVSDHLYDVAAGGYDARLDPEPVDVVETGSQILIIVADAADAATPTDADRSAAPTPTAFVDRSWWYDSSTGPLGITSPIADEVRTPADVASSDDDWQSALAELEGVLRLLQTEPDPAGENDGSAEATTANLDESVTGEPGEPGESREPAEPTVGPCFAASYPSDGGAKTVLLEPIHPVSRNDDAGLDYVVVLPPAPWRHPARANTERAARIACPAPQ